MGDQLAEVLLGRQDGAEAGEVGAEPTMRTPRSASTCLHRRQEVVRPDALAQIAEIDHQDDVVDARHAARRPATVPG